MRREADTGATQPQAKGAWGPQKREEARRTLPRSLGREPGPADTLTVDFWPPEL